MSRLIVVSNRVNPPENRNDRSTGGLAVAISAALREYSGFWFGWSGVVADGPDSVKARKVDDVTVVTVDLDQADYDEYYNGYANGTLWPLFHSRIDLTAYERAFGQGYERVNRRFADALAPLVEPDDLIWVHDYHLIPLGKELRRLGVPNPIGFFLHIPWPAPQLLTTLPHHARLVESLFDYDLVGFQTDQWLSAFEAYVLDEADGRWIGDEHLAAFGRRLRVAAFPVGLDVDEFTALVHSETAGRAYDRMAAHTAFRSLIIGVDRLDYTKGLEERLVGFESFLNENPQFLRKVQLLQIAPTSRGEVGAYQEIRARIEGVCGRINANYADVDWAPIRYVNRNIPRDELAGYYRAAQVGLVTPMRDGMNLVAKEYVAAQNPEDPGVLVLSRFAGAARQMTAAVIVNPYSREEVSEGLKRALTMEREERIERWESLIDGVRASDVKVWRDSFVEALRSARSGDSARREEESDGPSHETGETRRISGETRFFTNRRAERRAHRPDVRAPALRHPEARREPPAL
jgi:trehalose 6-phosphate synthase